MNGGPSEPTLYLRQAELKPLYILHPRHLTWLTLVPGLLVWANHSGEFRDK